MTHNQKIHLRTATMVDAKLLYNWRNDPETRIASFQDMEINYQDHLSWLEASLNNEKRRLYIADLLGKAVGTVRADDVSGTWVLSWTVAAEARHQGVAKHMVHELAQKISDPIAASIKIENAASVRVAEYAGMQFEKEVNGVLYYRRDALAQLK